MSKGGKGVIDGFNDFSMNINETEVTSAEMNRSVEIVNQPPNGL